MRAGPTGSEMWDQATSTRGGRLAVGVAIALACLLALTAGVALAASARGDRTASVAAQQDDTSAGDTTGTASGRANGQANGKANGQAKGQGDAGSQGDLMSIPGRLGDTLHGELTRPTATGTETLLVQTGTIAAASATEVTVRSTDGFTETYALDATTQRRGPAKAGGLATGLQVTVVATQEAKRALLVASKGGSS